VYQRVLSALAAWILFPMLFSCAFDSSDPKPGVEDAFRKSEARWKTYRNRAYTYSSKLDFVAGTYEGMCEVSPGGASCSYIGTVKGDTLVRDDPGRLENLFAEIGKRLFGGIQTPKYDSASEKRDTTSLFSMEEAASGRHMVEKIRYHYDPDYGFPDFIWVSDVVDLGYRIRDFSLK
jgi:hypothetical protein